jgi:hypothetical protein
MQPESLASVAEAIPETAPQARTITFAVDPKRLVSGQWCHRLNKDLGEGDIAASYSADRIAMDQPIRRTFPWQGSEWVCVSMQHRDGVTSASAYRVLDLRGFEGDAVSYSDKTRDGDAARSDPKGFYHGMKVKYAGRTCVLYGPSGLFEAGEPDQRSLFDW